ncbi:MAG: LacI family DNA-binding transcriptional regulator [Bacteroidales bacterium]|nr:LacI family DNA-binding transcriptional regulator [Candidatus Cryptobacteroides aphodequi]
MAKRTGYSVTTVSRVISGNAASHRIPENTAKAIMDEVKRCNYTPSAIAKSLRTSKSGTIGLILPSVANPYFAEIAGAVIAEAKAKGYFTIVLDTMEQKKNMEECARILYGRQVEGMIVIPSGDDPSLLERLDSHLPIVLMDRSYDYSTLSYVTTNNYEGGLMGTRLLIKSGHTRIACIQGEKEMPVSERVKGYRDAMREAGLEENISISGNEFSAHCGYLETALLLSSEDRPTAIFALSSTILLGAMKAIKEHQLMIPDDIALLSFDDNLYMDYTTPVITRIRQPLEDMAKLAVKILFGRIENTLTASSQLRLSPSLITGESHKTCHSPTEPSVLQGN